MTNEELQAKLDDVQRQFDENTKRKQELTTQLETVDIELYRLQGDYRTLQGLLPTPNTTDPNTVEVVPEAEVIPNKSKEK